MFKIFSILFSNIFENVLNIRKRKMNLSKNRVSTFPAGQLKRKIVVLNKEVIIIGEEKKFLSNDQFEFISKRTNLSHEFGQFVTMFSEFSRQVFGDVDI